MFRFTRKPSSGSHSQYLTKITHLVQIGYIELVQDIISVMAAYYDLWGVCAVLSLLYVCNEHHGGVIIISNMRGTYVAFNW